MPPDSIRLFVALRPSETLDVLVRHHKRRLLAAAGPQLYATDPPHTTLYLANFSLSRVTDLLHAVGQLAAQTEIPDVTIDGWRVFPDDPLTGQSTLVCRLSEESCERLRLVQLRVLDALAPLHDAEATLEAIAPRMAGLSADQRCCAEQYGFPYVGRGWIPHLTIASVRASEWPHVGQVFNLSYADRRRAARQDPADDGDSQPLARDGVAACGRFVALDVFELEGLQPRHLAAFSLARPQIGKAA